MMHGTINIKYISITYFECVPVATIIQYKLRMYPIIFSIVSCLALQYFSTLSHKRHDFRKKNIEHKMCFDISYIFVWYFLNLKKNWARYDQKCILVFI